MNQILAGKVAVITGASSGIGRAAALALTAEGARVALGARRLTEGEETARLVREAGGEAVFVETDVRHSDQVQRLIQTAVDRWGKLDCAFNNAGIEGDVFVPTGDYSESTWDQVIAINLTGVFLSMKYEIRQMLQNGGGAIVNMSSVAGLVGGPVGVAYYASKHRVVGMTRAAAIKYGNLGIRVNIRPARQKRTDMMRIASV